VLISIIRMFSSFFPISQKTRCERCLFREAGVKRKASGNSWFPGYLLIAADCPQTKSPGKLRAALADERRAMNTVHPKLQAFYSSLSDEQRARFNTMGPQNASSAEERQGSNR
jgi:hypothetical protein